LQEIPSRDRQQGYHVYVSNKFKFQVLSYFVDFYHNGANPSSAHQNASYNIYEEDSSNHQSSQKFVLFRYLENRRLAWNNAC
jgi:hypothetical protein